MGNNREEERGKREERMEWGTVRIQIWG